MLVTSAGFPLTGSAKMELCAPMKRLLPLLWLFALPALAPGGGKSPGLSVSFHAEGDEFEGQRMVRADPEKGPDGKKHFFRISPVVTNKNFKGFAVFPADDGSFGAAFKLDNSGWESLLQTAAIDSGKLMRVIVNGRPVDFLRIDKPRRNDHTIVVWKGLSEEDVKALRAKYKELGAPPPDETSSRRRPDEGE